MTNIFELRGTLLKPWVGYKEKSLKSTVIAIWPLAAWSLPDFPCVSKKLALSLGRFVFPGQSSGWEPQVTLGILFRNAWAVGGGAQRLRELGLALAPAVTEYWQALQGLA